MQKEVFAPWEIEHRREMREERKAKKMAKAEFQPSASRNSESLLRSYSQWKALGRRVVVPECDAKRVIDTLSGHKLPLFSEDQTALR